MEKSQRLGVLIEIKRIAKSLAILVFVSISATHICIVEC